MSEAIVRVQRMAGESTDALRKFNTEATAARGNARGAEEALADFQRRRDQYKRMSTAGRTLSPEEMAQHEGQYTPEQLQRARMITPPGSDKPRFVIPKPVDYSHLSDEHLRALSQEATRKKMAVDRELSAVGGGTSLTERAKLRASLERADPEYQAARTEYSEVTAELDRRRQQRSTGGPRNQSPEHLRRLGYSDEEIENARQLGPGGPMLLRQPQPPSLFTPAPGPSTTAARPSAAPERAEKRVENAEVDDGLDARAEKQRKVRTETDYSALSEQRLRAEWKQSARELREQNRELDGVANRMERLRRRGGHGTSAGREEMAELLQRQKDLGETAGNMQAKHGRIRSALEGRGFSVLGDQVWKEPGGGGWRQGVGTFIASTGFGGRFGGTIARVAAGLTPMRIGIGLAGMAAGRGLFRSGQADYGALANALTDAIPLSVTLGKTSPYDVKRRAAHDANTFGLYLPSDLLRTRRILAQSMGIDTLGSIPDVALLTGQDVQSEGTSMGHLSRFAARRDPHLSASLLGAFAMSRVPEARQGLLGMTTALYPHFTGAVGNAASTYVTPLTRVPVDAVGAHLSAMTRFETPGIDPHSAGAVDVAAGRLQALNRFTSGMINTTGVLGDLSYVGIRQLRGTETEKKLRDELGIDITTPVGIYRAARRAPELAARGIPEVAEAINRSFRNAYPDQSMRELVALTDPSVGGDPEAAALIARGDVAGIYRAQAEPGESLSPTLRRTASELVGSRPVQDVFEAKVRPAALPLEYEGADAVGRTIAATMNDLSASWRIVADVISSAMDEVRTVPDIVRGALNEDVGGPSAGNNR